MVYNNKYSSIRGLVFFLLVMVNDLSAFNLETRLPIIKEGPEESYFGYSVAAHQIVKEDGKKESVLLIGAPRAQASYLQDANFSGAVYSCPFSTLRRDCFQLHIDKDIDHGTPVIRNDQWLGVTVQSQGPGGFVMTCAHRFVLKGEDYQWGQGICYSLTQELNKHSVWEPCRNRPVNKAHEQFGYCQAGTSGQITEEANIVIGSPGTLTWRGTVFTNSLPSKIRFGKRWYHSPLMDETSPVGKYSYLGMAVTSGVFFNGKTSFVAGAPRSGGTGQVVFFTTESKNNPQFETEFILDGEQFASSFGYALTSLDVNNDGFLDLVVGAPFYYEKGKGGAVYIYENSKEGFNHDKPIKLTGKSESRFGFALENVGDLNKDGYMDLAVGAPYEEGGGAVYIYMGSSSGLMIEPSQVIYAKDILESGNLTTLGYSFAGRLDLDDNSYPDLLIGSYESNKAVLLRSRPVLDIITSVTDQPTNIDPDKKGCEKDPDSPLVCFSFEACFQFNSSDKTVGTSIKLEYKIEAETFTGRKYYRVRFKSSLDSNTPNIVKKELTMKGSAFARKHCSEEVVYLKDKSDIQNPVQFKLTYSLIQKEPIIPLPGAPLPDLNLFPILNQQEASKIFEVKFLKDCGLDEICESDLEVVVDINLPKDEQGEPVLFLGEKQVTLSVKVTNNEEPAYDSMLYIIHSPSLSYVGRKIVKGDQIECIPFNATVSCELGNPLKQGKMGEVELQVRFNPKEVSDEEKSLKFTIKANSTSVASRKRDDITVEVGVVKVAELEIRGVSQPEQAFYGGEVKGVPTYEEDVGNEVVHIYEIINHGPWLATGVEMVVSWPFEEADETYRHGRGLLYITENPEVIGNGYCDLDSTQLNPLKLVKRPQELRLNSGGESGRVRQKRNVAPQELRMDGKTVKVVNLDCEANTARCIQFSCYFRSLERGNTAIVKIRARLWNNTLVENYPSVDWVSIFSRAYIRIAPDDIRQKEDNDFAYAETKAYPDIQLYQKPEEVPLWIIILAACAGVLLLVILILILWKCGFFKRKKPGYEPAPTSDKEYM